MNKTTNHWSLGLNLKWINKHIKFLSHLSLPNRSLKYFPPDFIIRDPIVSLIQRYLKNGEHCAIILFHFESFEHMITSYPKELIDKVQHQIKDSIKRILPKHVKEKNIIGVKQFHEDDYCLFLRVDQTTTHNELSEKAHIIRKKLESELQLALQSSIDGYIHFQTGVFTFSHADDVRDAGAAVHNAYRYAYALAKRRLPTNFYWSRERLQSIIEGEEISVLAQPIMNLKTGDIFGWELLTRGPEGTRFHLPTELFSFAHQADLLTKMEFLVMKKALEEISNQEIKESVFINITSVSLCHPFFLNRLLEYIQVYDDISPKQIILEITERHSIRDFDHMALIMKKFRSHGFRFAVDDAGAGYSSLQTISELIPDIIKIDKSVIQNIDQVSVKQTVLKALLFFADNINCQVIAEGVETEEEAEILFEHQVQMGQGYYFARPESFLFDYAPNHFELMKEKIMFRQQTGNPAV
jgi:EAL domain-containing protein (putative c-di-GMP-specific phosphodiesterase class I)